VPQLRRLVLVAGLVLFVGCPHPKDAAPPRAFTSTDVPWELEDGDDWAEMRDRMLGLSPTDARRHDLRVQLAAAQADRIGHWLDADRPTLAYEAMLDLVRMWTDDPENLGVELAAQRDVIARARGAFARAGADAEVVLSLIVLSEIEPEKRAARWDEVDEVLAFSDELAVAENGDLAVRARPIELLEPVALAWPLRTVTDRYIALVVERQKAVADALDKKGASFELVRAHTGVLRAARTLAAALARAGRPLEIAALLAPMSGIGTDEALAQLAAAVAADGAGARDYVKFARAFRSHDDDDDPGSARAVALAGLARFPDDTTLLGAEARASTDLGRVHEPIRLYESVARLGGEDDEVVERLALLYQRRLEALALSGRPVEAEARLTELEAFFKQAGKAHPGRPWSERRAAAFETMGRGLVAQGELDAAADYLRRSVKLDPDVGAFEMLATIALKRQEWRDAIGWAERGADLSRDASVPRAHLLKIAGDAAAGAGDGERARDRWIAALQIWAELGDSAQLAASIAGERLVQGGQLLWSLGEKDEALRLLEASVDVDPDGADTYTAVVAFFIVNDDYPRALDAFHRAVIADRIGDYYKVYMSLWVVAEARRREVDPDPLAVEFLAKRDGALWHDDMARLATGRVQVAELEPRATNRARRAELEYYTAMLGLGGDARADIRALLEEVISAEAVLYPEYDMARHWLAVQ
jgi:tetratricopeptide (TPR) repeat protein